MPAALGRRKRINDTVDQRDTIVGARENDAHLSKATLGELFRPWNDECELQGGLAAEIRLADWRIRRRAPLI